jgi:hypothetical protein
MGLGLRVVLTVLGGALLIASAFLDWLGFEGAPKGTEVPIQFLWSPAEREVPEFATSLGFVVIVLGVLAIIGLVPRTGWLTSLAGARRSTTRSRAEGAGAGSRCRPATGRSRVPLPEHPDEHRPKVRASSRSIRSSAQVRVAGFRQYEPIRSTRSRSGSMGRGAVRRGDRDRARRGVDVACAQADRVSRPEATPWNRRARTGIPVHVHSRM